MVAKAGDDIVSQTLDQLPDIEFISSGVKEIDETIGGFARGRITEIWGQPGVGKSYLLAKTMAAMPEGQKTLYIDAEYSLVKDRLAQLGVNMKQITYVQDGRLERVADMIVDKVGTFDLIILDSLPKLIPEAVATSDTGANAIGLFARQVKHFEAKLKPRLATSKTVFVVINQARAGMGLMQPSKPQGGFAWEHAIDIRLKLYKPQKSKIEQQRNGVKHQLGHRACLEVQKTRLTQPGLIAHFDVMYS